jgi:hypothetical protein
MSEAKTTTDHRQIQKWVEARGGIPAHVKRTGRGRDLGVLRIDYPGFSGEESLERISWDDWFKAFDAHQLAFLYQDSVKGGAKSRFSKLVAREGRRATPRRVSGAKRTTSRRATAQRGAAKRGSAKRSSAKRSMSGSAGTRAGAKRSTAKRSSVGRASTARGAAKKRSTLGRGAPKKRATSRSRTKKRSSART